MDDVFKSCLVESGILDNVYLVLTYFLYSRLEKVSSLFNLRLIWRPKLLNFRGSERPPTAARRYVFNAVFVANKKTSEQKFPYFIACVVICKVFDFIFRMFIITYNYQILLRFIFKISIKVDSTFLVEPILVLTQLIFHIFVYLSVYTKVFPFPDSVEVCS